ncbi:anthranilate synthase family protein [Geodermatophilus maliterrae]|uniref:anthranilate synthase n=1 Tax=Geodermatophilus maliterrae TaxID=3162531 RepID=A0ABV3XH78_9ACTN
MPDPLLARLVADPTPPPFAVLRRQEGPGVEVLVGDLVDVPTLADIPLTSAAPAGPQVLALVPYRQVVERGFVCHDDGAPLRCLVVRERELLEARQALDLLPDGPVDVEHLGFDVDDEAYAATVAAVVTDEIGRGEGADFVVRRDHRARTSTPPAQAALRLLRRLLVSEPGAYWTFAVSAGEHTLVGATPERHVCSRAGEVLMNPISGTYRHPATGPDEQGLLAFLGDTKETEELFMVVDEELKMMSAVCPDGGRVLGPYLQQMSALTHTEYLLQGRSDLDVRDVLRETAFAPTVTGSPVRNAARVIRRYETTPRGYYSGVLALLGYDDEGRQTLDAPIVIRTAHLDADGGIRVPVGATLVRDSVPEHEVAETHAKAAAVLRALDGHAAPPPAARLADAPAVRAALDRRNRRLARFWLEPQAGRELPALRGRSALVVDAEDAWTAMLATQLRRLGLRTDVVAWDAAPEPDGYDLLVAGPGPGDPRVLGDPRIAALRGLVHQRLTRARPLLAVCLSHQVLAQLLGLPVRPLPRPHQGTQRRLDLFGRDVRMGFYNTFAAGPGALPEGVEAALDPRTGEVHALRGPAFASVQFHLESLLSPDGADVLAGLTAALLAGRPPRDGRADGP